MHIGIDLDNTIVRYDRAFHRLALERDLIPDSLPARKDAVRNHLRACDREDEWTRLQGYVYGRRMDLAEPFDGVAAFFARAREMDQAISIVSHKTRYPYCGPRYDLHDAAKRFLADRRLFEPSDPLVDLHFEPTKEAKLARIAALGCTHFVDDLPEFLGEAAFPARVRRFLFDPAGQHDALDGDSHFVRATSWPALAELLLPMSDTAS